MADDILNLSLDDIIKRNAEKTKGSKPRADRRENRADKPGIRKTAGGGIAKAKAVPVKIVGGRGGKPGPKRERVAPEVLRRDRAVKRAALEGDGKWTHDKFAEVAGAAPRRGGAAGGGAGGAKLLISGLGYHVSDDDLRELFESCGRLRNVRVIYDRSGRSEGRAEVTFEVAADAEKAKRQYNGALLDGKPMQLEVQALNGARGGVTTLSSGIRIQTNATAPAANGGGPSRTGLTLPRALMQANTATARPAGRQGPARGRLQSTVVRQPRGRGPVTTDFMEE